ncbi:cell division protein FtsW [Trueperella bonasi]|uniref:Probable peptidoglycan glycosyltransferase FtsW n=1 Tax=Trueperella bonasi TaxID=312286 RepID=A0ABT9NI58_9ACTO|nr:FtsW/RodA/SpoVE family cell cycle protein [Trueperella bonasi]MDP9807014.1 cell division protein FtsW [Trueperella bonasi]
MAAIDAKPLTENGRMRRDAVHQGLMVVLLSTAALVAIGLVMVFSATAPASIRVVDANPDQALFSVAIRQVISAIIGIVFGIILAVLPARIFNSSLAHGALGLGVLLQIGVLLQGGEGVGGNNNWLDIGPIAIQPSEFLKLAMVVWLAYMLSCLTLKEIRTPQMLVIPTLGFAAAIGVVALGGDLGTALIFAMIALGMFWIAGVRGKHLVFPILIGGFLGGILVVARPSRLRRVGDFFGDLVSLPDIHSPTQIEFAQFAFGSGGVTGVGIGAGKEKWWDLKEAHTDFIFAVVGEELGLLGVLAVIALFLALGWGLKQIAFNHPNRYGQLVTGGAAMWLCGQAFANMLVVAGLLPVFGVPLPFISYGGSSMIATLGMVGIVTGSALSVPGVKESFRVPSRLAHGARTLVRRNG